MCDKKSCMYYVNYYATRCQLKTCGYSDAQIHSLQGVLCKPNHNNLVGMTGGSKITTKMCTYFGTIVNCDSDCINCSYSSANTKAKITTSGTSTVVYPNGTGASVGFSDEYKKMLCDYNKQYNLCNNLCNACTYHVSDDQPCDTNAKEAKCECGAERCGEPRHSDWCPKYKENK